MSTRKIDKRHTRLLKLCRVVVLSFPVAKSHFTKHLQTFKEKTFIFREENFKKLHHEHKI